MPLGLGVGRLLVVLLLLRLCCSLLLLLGQHLGSLVDVVGLGVLLLMLDWAVGLLLVALLHLEVDWMCRVVCPDQHSDRGPVPWVV